MTDRPDPRSEPPSASTFAHLLDAAVNQPGLISKAYRAFHGYSLGNRLLALSQCVERGIPPGPLATYPRWQALGRQVRKGAKGLSLCMPVTLKRVKKVQDGSDEAHTFIRFVLRPNWFVLAQTDGPDLRTVATPRWDRETALSALQVTEMPFEGTDGNVMGYARLRTIAVSQLNPLPHKTRFHELAHILLGHTAEGDHLEGEDTPRNLRECEAEAVALVCCAALDLPGVEFSRGYIQSWWGAGNPIPERSAQRVLKVADQILKAGTVIAEVAA